jgi:hypothetical protein
VKTMLEKVEKGSGGAGDARSNQMKASRFVQECLMLLPSQICQAVGRQVSRWPTDYTVYAIIYVAKIFRGWVLKVYFFVGNNIRDWVPK